MKKILIILLLTTIPLLAQQPEMHLEGTPIQINEPFEPRRDINGKLCSIIKVISEMEGFKYDALSGVVGSIIDKPGGLPVGVAGSPPIINIAAAIMLMKWHGTLTTQREKHTL